jgi:carbamoylphosphate synthase large subunit
MTEYKNILIGTNVFSSDWTLSLNKLKDKQNIIICDFNDLIILENILLKKNISYILPLSNKDNDLIKTNIEKLNININIKILYPTKEVFNLLDNKNSFTEYMLKNYINYIPDIYYLNNIKLKDIEFPAISKPIYSTNGSNMKIIMNNDDFINLNNNHNNIQKYIESEYEYGGYFLCIDGIIIKWKIIRFKYKKFNIKKSNFPRNFENIKNISIDIFNNIIQNLNYSGGMCINFKINECNNIIYIFEINPRFGGSAFTHNFIYELLCVS